MWDAQPAVQHEGRHGVHGASVRRREPVPRTQGRRIERREGPRRESGEAVEGVGGDVDGRSDLLIRGVNALEAAAEDEITFLADAHHAGEWGDEAPDPTAYPCADGSSSGP